MVDVHRDLLRLLQRAGLRFANSGTADGLADLLLIGADGISRPAEVKIYPHAKLTPSAVRAVLRRRAQPGLLFAAPDAGEKLIAEALAGTFDLALVQHSVVIIGGRLLLDERPTRPGRPGVRVPWQRHAVQRVLAVAERPLSQREIAARTGASQQGVSKVIKELPHISRTDAGWIGDRDLLDQWLRDYPSPRGAQTHWYGLGSAADQLGAARALLTELSVGSVLSGELAADHYVPWMLPGAVRLYLDEFIDFAAAGFTPADAPDATMTIVMPEDPSIAPAAHHWGADAPGASAHVPADPAIVMWDLWNTSTDPTAPEAAERIRRMVEANRSEL